LGQGARWDLAQPHVLDSKEGQQEESGLDQADPKEKVSKASIGDEDCGKASNSDDIPKNRSLCT
jgi:hypothetical protein